MSVCVNMQTCAWVNMPTRARACEHADAPACVNVQTCAHVCVNMHTHLCVCVCVLVLLLYMGLTG